MRSKVRLLIVDDSIFIHKLIGFKLKEIGIDKIFNIYKGSETVEFLKTHTVHIVILDRYKPDIDVFETVKLINEKYLETKVIMSSPDFRQECKDKEFGVLGHLPYPLGAPNVNDKIIEIIDKAIGEIRFLDGFR